MGELWTDPWTINDPHLPYHLGFRRQTMETLRRTARVERYLVQQETKREEREILNTKQERGGPLAFDNS